MPSRSCGIWPGEDVRRVQNEKECDRSTFASAVRPHRRLPLVMVKNSEFGGADGAAEEAVQKVDPDYEPWAESILEPPGGETESLLFCLQAGLGAGVLGFGFGWLVARKKYRNDEASQ